jgi:hypothetical protein
MWSPDPSFRMSRTGLPMTTSSLAAPSKESILAMAR